MRELDLVEQEELAKLKSIWHEYGLIIIVGVVVFFGVYGGTRYWEYYKREQANSAAYLYETYLEKLVEADSDNALKIVKSITEEYKNTPYASLVNLQQAREYYLAEQEQDKEKSIAHLKWVVENGNDEFFRDSARLQLMQLLIDTDKCEQAIRYSEDQESLSMAMGIYELKGDCYVKLGKFQMARDAYQLSIKSDIIAMGKLGQSIKANPIVSMKLQSLPK